MSVENNKALARRVVTAFNAGDVSMSATMFTDDLEYRLAGYPDVHGREQFTNFVLEIRRSFPDFTFTIEDVVAEGDKVAFRFVARGTHRGTLQGIPPTNKPSFFEPGVFGWPEHACRGCSLGADQVAHLAHLNARDTTLAYASRAPQKDIERLKARMGWKMPWYTITDSFDIDFGVDQWHGHNAFIRDGDKVFRTYFINERGDEAMGTVWSYLDMTALGRQEIWENSPEGYPQERPYKWWNWHDNYDAEPTPHPKWLDILTDPVGAAARRREEEAKAS